MGVEGAALASVISQTISAIFVIVFLCSKKSIIRLKFSQMKINFKKTEQAKRIETSYAMNAIDGASFTPIRKTSGAIGYDCFACLDQELAIFPGDVVKIGTGICLDMASSDTYIDLQIDK